MKNDIRDNGVLDAILAIVIAAAGVILLLAYFDILVKWGVDMHQDQINQIADNALDAAVLSIQNELGQEHGDIAGIVFAGANGDAILSILRSYIRTELSFKE
jgi:hypothetical protein